MKKIKLITTLSSLGLVASTVPVMATSCSNSERSGSLAFNSDTDLYNYVNEGHYVDAAMPIVNIASNNPTNIASFLNKYVKAIHIVDGYLAYNASLLKYYNEHEAGIKLEYFNIEWTTTNSEIRVTDSWKYVNDSNVVTEVTKFIKVTDSYFDKVYNSYVTMGHEYSVECNTISSMSAPADAAAYKTYGIHLSNDGSSDQVTFYVAFKDFANKINLTVVPEPE